MLGNDPALAGIRFVALACAVWLTAGAALAQPAPATPAAPADPSTTVSGIVVQAAPSRKAMQTFTAAVDNFVHSQGRPGIGPVKQLTQWSEPVCPTTSGLDPEFDDFVSKRIKQIAARVGAPGDGKCREADVLVVFTTRPNELMADVRDHHPGLLGYHFIGETRTLAAFEPPMKSWYVTATSVPKDPTKNAADAQVLDRAYAPLPFCTDQHSCRMPPPLKSRFAFALVVIDANRILGKPIGAVADEIAMTVLSRPGPREGCSPLPTVMDVLDPACAASQATAGLTAYDEAFLKALYAPHDTEVLAYERAEIERSVAAVGRLASDGDPAPP